MIVFWTQVRRCLFLLLGLTRVYRPEKRDRSKGVDLLAETEGSKACRRNIMALASIVVVSGLAGADPRDLSVFGVKPDGEWGVIVIGAAVILTQIYWYFLRYHHLKEDGVIEQDPAFQGEVRRDFKIRLNHAFTLEQKSANLFANRISFLLTAISWYFVISWILEAYID